MKPRGRTDGRMVRLKDGRGGKKSIAAVRGKQNLDSVAGGVTGRVANYTLV